MILASIAGDLGVRAQVGRPEQAQRCGGALADARPTQMRNVLFVANVDTGAPEPRSREIVAEISRDRARSSDIFRDRSRSCVLGAEIVT